MTRPHTIDLTVHNVYPRAVGATGDTTGADMNIVELKEIWHKVDLVNELLAVGWVLISTHLHQDDGTVVYIVGRPTTVQQPVNNPETADDKLYPDGLAPHELDELDELMVRLDAIISGCSCHVSPPCGHCLILAEDEVDVDNLDALVSADARMTQNQQSRR